MISRSHLVLALVLTACGPERDLSPEDLRNRKPKPPDVTVPTRPIVKPPILNRPLDLGDPGIERASCEPGPDAPAFRMVAPAHYADAMLGSCGELAWNEAGSQALTFAGIDEEPRHVDEGGRARWIGGRRLLYARGGEVVLEETGEEPRTWEAPGAHHAAAIRDTGAFWVCSAERGIERLDADGITQLTPDFITGIEYGSGCFSIDVSGGGAIAYPTREHRLGVVDSATGARGLIDLPFYPDGTVDDEERNRMDVVRLGPDASFVLHEKRWLELMGDAIGPVGEGEVTIATAAAPTANRLPGMLGDAWVFKGTAGWDWMGPWMGTAPGVLLPTWYGSYLIGAGETRTFDDLYPRAIRGNHIFAETREGAALLDLTDGRLHQLFDAPAIEQVVPYRWGGPVAFSHPTRDCIRYPDRPDTCHARIWAVTVWSEKRGARRVAAGTERLWVKAIGPEGQILVAGALLDGPPPASAEPRQVDWRLAVLGADGGLVRELDPEMRIDEGVGGAHFAVLERPQYDGTRRWSELVRLDWATGDEEILAAGRFIQAWALDHSDSRVSALVFDEESENTQIWTGVVGR